MTDAQPRFDLEADVVVVGFGYAGGIAAIEAAEAGARVVLVERAERPGGISVCSAGGLRVAESTDSAFAYLRATCGGKTPDAVLRALAEGMTTLEPRVRALARIDDAVVSRRPAEGNYPLPGHDTFGFVYVESVPGFVPERDYPRVEGAPAGAMLFRLVERNVAARPIEVRLGTRARRLLRDGAGRVCGVRVEGPAGVCDIGAAGAVVLACGGFEADPGMQAMHWPGGPALSAAYAGNTGDGIRMAQAVGADLWHMWHYHGCYGFRHPNPDFPFGIRVKRLPDWRPGGERALPPMAWILLDRHGDRFMNEYEPYLQDTGARPLAHYDPGIQDFPRVPAFLVVDEAGRRMYPLGKPTWNDPVARCHWSEDNRAEIEAGLFTTADDIAAVAACIGAPVARVEATIAGWNAACERGEDPDHGRPADTMVALREPPYHVAPVWPVVSNTQGGPVHDARQRVLDPFGEPIPGLYAAGELGSAFGHLYMSGGNLAECFIGGRIAGRAAAAERDRDGERRDA